MAHLHHDDARINSGVEGSGCYYSAQGPGKYDDAPLGPFEGVDQTALDGIGEANDADGDNLRRARFERILAGGKTPGKCQITGPWVVR